MMNSSILMVVLVHLCWVSFSVCRETMCIESERETLLKLKHDLKDPLKRLSSWNATVNSNCCQWVGVVCNNITSHVAELHLNTPFLPFDESLGDEVYQEALEENTRQAFGGEINPCLVDLKHLNYLDFSGNDFESMPIPSFIAAMTSLTHLNLSSAGFMGNIPLYIGNLSNLLNLDLSYLSLGSDETSFTKNVDRLSSLSKLRYLDLSNIRSLGGGMSIPSFIGTMTTLIHLDLSYSGFMGKIPPQFGNLSNLEYLDLSHAVNGTIPSQIRNLSNLLYLDLQSGYSFDETVFIGNVDWLSSLLKLEYLDLRGANLSQSFHWLHTLQALPSLMHLHLSECTLPLSNQPSFLNFSSLFTLDLSEVSHHYTISFIPKWVFRLKKLVSLSLYFNHFEGSIPDGLRNLTQLENLDLSLNSFSSSIPDWFYGTLSRLKFLDLSNNNLQGTILDTVGNLTSLVGLDLSNNQLDGPIPTSLGKLSSLVRLDLSHNQLEGPIPTSLGYLCNLREIDFSYLKLNQHVNEILDILGICISHGLTKLQVRSSQLSGNLTDQFGVYKSIFTIDFRDNKIGGVFPRSLEKLSSLRALYLSQNQLSGNPFESLRSLSKLSYLDIGDNCFQGVVMQDHLANLTRLGMFRAAGNNLTLKVSPNWNPTFQLHYLDMNLWHLGPNFPLWIQSQNNLQYLAMSNTGILDFVPTWFWETLSGASFLNLSHNHIHGELMLKSPLSITFVDLSANNLCGKLPSLLSGVVSLDLSSNSFSKSMDDFLCKNQEKTMQLQFLNLAYNNLSGEIPNCWTIWPLLVYINLQSNNFVGNLPASMGTLANMQLLQIRNNSLSGTFPTSLMKSNQLTVLDLWGNKLSGTIPKWVGEKFLNMKILCLGSNNFSSHIPNEICDMSLLQVLDLAQNSLSGNIPTCFSNFSAMTLMNRSTNSSIKYFSQNSTFYSSNVGIASVLLWLKGRGDEYRNILGLVTSIDLSNNQLVGEIPREITYLNSLIYLNLSHNQLVSDIPENIGNMGSLFSIDLSRNQLSGGIPQTISNLSFLSMLDLSYNHLKGKIPIGTQLQTFDASNFIGNNLCDPPLPINCSSNAKTDDFDHNDKGGDGHGVNWFFVSMTLGFVIGFWTVIGPLFICRTWRYAYFLFLDRVWFKLQSFF